MRCAKHGLACGPDGSCILCRRASVPAAGPRALGPTARTALVLGVLCVAATAAGAYRVRSQRLALDAAFSTANAPSEPLRAELPAEATAATRDQASAPASLAAPPSDPGHDEQLRRLRALAAGGSAPAANMRPEPAKAQAAAASDVAQSTASAAEAPTRSAPPSTAPPRDVHVVIYTTSWCSVCRRAKQWMVANGVSYEEHDVETSDESARRMRIINPRGSVPTFDVEGQVEIGFSPGGLLATMQRAEARRRM
jgi:glutaredoxin